MKLDKSYVTRCPLKVVECTSIVRTMRGGCRAELMRATDGHCYVVKRNNNAQGRRTVVNELVSHLLMEHLGLDTPPIALARTPDSLSALHFASQHPGTDATTVYDFMPDPLLAEVANREQFLGTLVFDKWTSNADGRQSIFYRARLVEDGRRDPERIGWVTQMIDNGLAFQGADWTFRDSPVQGLYPRALVYGDDPGLVEFGPWIDKLMSLKQSVLTEVSQLVPPAWIEGDESAFARLLKRLWSRRERVGALVGESLDWLQRKRMARQTGGFRISALRSACRPASFCHGDQTGPQAPGPLF